MSEQHLRHVQGGCFSSGTTTIRAGSNDGKCLPDPVLEDPFKK